MTKVWPEESIEVDSSTDNCCKLERTKVDVSKEVVERPKVSRVVIDVGVVTGRVTGIVVVPFGPTEMLMPVVLRSAAGDVTGEEDCDAAGDDEVDDGLVACDDPPDCGEPAGVLVKLSSYAI